jgi:steroid delta-isomerase-like uncharacterized protein
MEMSQIAVATSEIVVLSVLAHLKNGEIDAALECFADKFTYNDHGIGLQFKDKKGLAEFFRKTRELYPDSSVQTDTVFLAGDRAITEWTLNATLTAPIYGCPSRKVRILLPGASIVQTANGLITRWADYYDGLASRRTALAAHFTEWLEL